MTAYTSSCGAATFTSSCGGVLLLPRRRRHGGRAPTTPAISCPRPPSPCTRVGVAVAHNHRSRDETMNRRVVSSTRAHRASCSWATCASRLPHHGPRVGLGLLWSRPAAATEKGGYGKWQGLGPMHRPYTHPRACARVYARSPSDLRSTMNQYRGQSWCESSGRNAR